MGGMEGGLSLPLVTSQAIHDETNWVQGLMIVFYMPFFF